MPFSAPEDEEYALIWLPWLFRIVGAVVGSHVVEMVGWVRNLPVVMFLVAVIVLVAGVKSLIVASKPTVVQLSSW